MNERILIVEDEAITALDLKYSLEELGYQIIDTVDTGQDAIDTAAETIPVGTVAANTTGWSYTPSTTDTDHITAGSANDTPVATSKLKTGEASHATGNDGRSFMGQYAVSTGNDVSAQTYEGSIAYTLNQVTGSGSGS